MKLWISSETQSDVFDMLRVASINIEDSINEVISNKNYDIPLDSWDCIVILRDDDNFEELTNYSPKRKEMDFRLKIDYQGFKNGNEKEREKYVFEMLMRSLILLEKKGLSGSGMNQLVSDVKNVGKVNDWI